MQDAPLLTSISEELADSLRARGRVRTLGPGEEIFARGDSASYLPIVLSGSVKMMHFLEPGREVIIDIFREGEMFAVPPVFDGAEYPATAIAMIETQLLLLPRNDFLDLLRESDEFAFAVIGWMCSMLREKTATIQNLAIASPEQRVGYILFRLAAKAEAPIPFKVPLRRKDIAHMAGLTTETTIRAVRKLAEKDLVGIKHGKIIIETTGPLRRFLQR
jgi:CRP/FNR family transcriptional regulator, dissimilatory nitrate respiration regulator